MNTLLAQMYTRGASYGGKDPSSDIGVNVAVLKDDMNPEDVHPRTPGALRGKVCGMDWLPTTRAAVYSQVSITRSLNGFGVLFAALLCLLLYNTLFG